MIPKEVLRSRIARIIAATRFPFVDQTDWGEGYVTVVNDEEKRRGVEGPEGTFYPSIVVTDANNGIREVVKWRWMTASRRPMCPNGGSCRRRRGREGG